MNTLISTRTGSVSVLTQGSSAPRQRISSSPSIPHFPIQHHLGLCHASRLASVYNPVRVQNNSSERSGSSGHSSSPSSTEGHRCSSGCEDPSFSKPALLGSAREPSVLGVSVSLAFAGAWLCLPQEVQAMTVTPEPSNALSLPTWAIHVSSVLEWIIATKLMWQYAEVTGNDRWREMSLMMMPSLASAMAACTWHFFYNSQELEFLVVLQAGMTVLGNCTLAWGAYRLWDGAQTEAKA